MGPAKPSLLQGFPQAANALEFRRLAPQICAARDQHSACICGWRSGTRTAFGRCAGKVRATFGGRPGI
eukprot:9149293-Lingulodinium_polyedra.AAC.1